MQFALLLHLFCVVCFFLVPLLDLWKLLPKQYSLYAPRKNNENKGSEKGTERMRKSSTKKMWKYSDKKKVFKKRQTRRATVFCFFLLLYFCFLWFAFKKVILAPCIYGLRAELNPFVVSMVSSSRHHNFASDVTVDLCRVSMNYEGALVQLLQPTA